MSKETFKTLSAEEAIERLRVAQTGLFMLAYDMQHPKSKRSWAGEIDSHAIVLLNLVELNIKDIRGQINKAVHDEAAEEAVETKARMRKDRQEKDTFTANN